MLGVQALAVICIVFWAVSSTFLLLWLVNKVTPIRMSPKDEILGADYTEHNIMPSSPTAAEAITDSSSTVRNGEIQITQRTRPAQSESDSVSGLYKTYFTDELASDQSKTPVKINPAYQHDEAA